MSTNSNMEETYLLEVDSSQRDLTLYPNSNNYSVTINRPIYNVSNIKLVAARIPLTQWTIDEFNDTFTYDIGAGDVTVTLTKQDYISGAALAAELATQLTAASITAVYNTGTENITFTHGSGTPFSFTMGTNSPAAVLGLLPTTVTSSSGVGVLITKTIDLDGPTSLILSLSGDDRDDLKNELYIDGTEEKPMHYFGRIITTQYTLKRLIDYNGNDDPVRNMFHRGSEAYIEKLDINFYWNNFKKVNPYDFKLRNHILKFEITCSLDKLSLSKENDSDKRLIELPPKMKMDRFDSPVRLWGNRNVAVYGGAGIVFVLIILILTSFKRVLPRK